MTRSAKYPPEIRERAVRMVFELDLSTGREVLVLTGQTLGLTDLAFSPDGTRLAASSNDGTVRIYVLPVQDLIDLARSRLTRGWTQDECQQYLHLDHCPSG